MENKKYIIYLFIIICACFLLVGYFNYDKIVTFINNKEWEFAESFATIKLENISQVGNSVTGAINNLNSNLENIPKIKRKLLTYDGPCTSGRPIQISEDAYGQNSVYSISVVLAAGTSSFDHGDVYRDNAGHIMYIPNTTQSAINIRISIVYI